MPPAPEGASEDLAVAVAGEGRMPVEIWIRNKINGARNISRNEQFLNRVSYSLYSGRDVDTIQRLFTQDSAPILHDLPPTRVDGERRALYFRAEDKVITKMHQLASSLHSDAFNRASCNSIDLALNDLKSYLRLINEIRNAVVLMRSSFTNEALTNTEVAALFKYWDEGMRITAQPFTDLVQEFSAYTLRFFPHELLGEINLLKQRIDNGLSQSLIVQLPLASDNQTDGVVIQQGWSQWLQGHCIVQ